MFIPPGLTDGGNPSAWLRRPSRKVSSAIGVTDHDDVAAGFAVADAVSKRGLPLVSMSGKRFQLGSMNMMFTYSVSI